MAWCYPWLPQEQRGLEVGVQVLDWTDAVTGDSRLSVRTFGFQSVVNGNAFEVTWLCTWQNLGHFSWLPADLEVCSLLWALVLTVKIAPVIWFTAPAKPRALGNVYVASACTLVRGPKVWRRGSRTWAAQREDVGSLSPPKFLEKSLKSPEFALTSVSLSPFSGPQALGPASPLVLPASRSRLRLAGGWGAMTPRLGANEKHGCSPRGYPALPVLLRVRVSSCKAIFLRA